MKAQKITKFIWDELTAFLAWAVPTLWNMFANQEPKEKQAEITGFYETEDGHIFTHYSDGTTEAGPPTIKGPF